MQDEHRTRQQLIQELEETGQEYQNLFELAGDSIFIVEPASLSILDANANAARRLGYTREELLALSIDDIEILTTDGPLDPLAWESRFSRTSVYECRHRHKDGRMIPVEVSSRVVRRNGQAVLLNLARDISRRKQIASEREQLIVELDAYAHTVAHDLKGPLAVLMGYSDMLLDYSDDASEEETREWIAAIRRTGHKMQNIIDELLVLASVRKMDEFQLETLDMAAIVSEALGRLSNVISGSGAEVVTPQSWPSAAGYPSWVEEIWVNYISNGIKYGGDPPRIELGATADDDGMLRFWVRDNGRGLTPEEQVQVFGQFTRLDVARAEGHGLGLSIVQRIAEKLGGEVGVQSQVGEGSVFSFSLPAAGQESLPD